MIPVKNSAGGAAFISKHQAEWTPNKHTNKIANVKRNADQQKMSIIDNVKNLKRADNTNKSHPDKQHSARSLICIDYVLLKLGFVLDLFKRGTEFLLKELL
jgi:hypothetical protein